jgi:spermidine/putrescine transport system substrate-binding protein
MRRRTVLPLLAAGAVGCRRGPRLNVLNWSDYIAPDTISGFERETGVPVRYGTFESAEEMLAKVLTGNSGWDVVVMPQNYLQAIAGMGLLAEITHARVPGLANLETLFHSPPWDPALRWSVPYLYGSTGIVYHKSVDPAPRRWADLWDVRLRGRLTMMDDPVEVFGACLKKLGLSVNATGDDELRRARDEAIRQKPLVRAYINADARFQLAAGDVAVAQLWATSAALALDDAPDLRYAHPAEGFALSCDNAVILRESRRAELAHAFLDYVLRPPVAAAIATVSRSATPNLPARELLAPQVRSSPVLYPAPDVLARGEWFTGLPPQAQKLRDRYWTEIKSA